MKPIYKSVILKLSGEALFDSNTNNILCAEKLNKIIDVIEEIYKSGVKIGVVVGAGNIFRGRIANDIGVSTSDGDYMGMAGTIINLKAISSLLSKRNIPNILFSALALEDVAIKYDSELSNKALSENKICLFAGGIGKPNYTTDTCAASRAIENNCDCILMGKYGVDGVYSKDPRKFNDAKFLKTLNYREVIDLDLKVMDITAIKLLLGHNITTKVFSMDDMNNFIRVIEGKDVGTTIKEN